MGAASCEATTTLTFSEDGIFNISANGALCDMFYDPNRKSVTWTRENDQIKVSSAPGAPYTLKGNKLIQITTFTSGGSTYTLVRIYGAK
ncbi:hypothetical protein [Pedobacter agri]|uniref:hypothetical protein n=1 Tax=Pedobacter agri TaxID=454586 RepID=UPI00293026ED|nr:hypothetical protein [Pedobacter agri]